ncbi:glycerate kinase [Salmonella enterica]|nr:glycerate kinase [Salmonella enterica]EHQ4622020.1 DUF4147 domain-containing protein [Salmonella enterica]EID6667102.1 DUF4147 domain-containing protein [Salmonella enterica]
MKYIKNQDELITARPEEKLRRDIIDIAENVLDYVNPGLITRKIVQLNDNQLIIQNKSYQLTPETRIFVIGAGKATFPVVKALEDILGKKIYKGAVICKKGEKGTLNYISLYEGNHPVPDDSSLKGAQAVTTILREVRSGDIVIACISGGSSSLLVSPVPGVSLDDKAATSKILLTCGANIIEINSVRKHLSLLKGGKLIQALPPGTHLINLTVSDVIGDALDYITDPSVPDTSTFADAQRTLDKYQLWDRLPHSVVEHIRKADPQFETMREDDLSHIDRQDIVLLPADAACQGAILAAKQAGYTPLLLSNCFEGESSALGRNFVAIAKQILQDGHPVSRPCCVIGGGETTVLISSGFKGEGGPNQEFALSAAADMQGMKGLVVLGLDTDGTDGPTPYAGGLVDGYTFERASNNQCNPMDCLKNHNVSQALIAAKDIVVSGNTGTNVNDLKLMLIQ